MADHYRGVIFETPLQNDIRYIQCSRLAHPTPALTSPGSGLQHTCTWSSNAYYLCRVTPASTRPQYATVSEGIAAQAHPHTLQRYPDRNTHLLVACSASDCSGRLHAPLLANLHHPLHEVDDHAPCGMLERCNKTSPVSVMH